MYQEKVIALLGRTMDRGTTLDEEKTSVAIAVKIVRKNNPAWPDKTVLDSHDLHAVKLAWPLWYDWEGNLKDDHEQIRVKVREAAKAQKPKTESYAFYTDSVWDDIFGQRGPWPGESEAEFVRRRAREAEDFMRQASQAAREREQQRSRQQRQREEEEAARAAQRARERAERDRKDKEEREAAERRRNEKARRAAKAKPGTIGAYANRLLMEVRFEVGGSKWGWSYMEVYEKIRERFPGAQTSLQSLRWYETKLRRYYGKDAVPHRVNDWAG